MPQSAWRDEATGRYTGGFVCDGCGERVEGPLRPGWVWEMYSLERLRPAWCPTCAEGHANLAHDPGHRERARRSGGQLTLFGVAGVQ